jgi:hypothetical protein
LFGGHIYHGSHNYYSIVRVELDADSRSSETLVSAVKLVCTYQ